MEQHLNCLKVFNKIIWNLQGFESPVIFSLKQNKMKTFNDLQFERHIGHGTGVMSRIYFDNGYGASVVKTPYTYGGDKGLYELAVLDKNGNLTYDTPITNDVIGYLRPEDVTDVMEKIQKLENVND